MQNSNNCMTWQWVEPCWEGSTLLTRLPHCLTKGAGGHDPHHSLSPKCGRGTAFLLQTLGLFSILLQLLSETDLNLQHVLFVLFLLWGRKKAGSRIILTLPQKAFKKKKSLGSSQRPEGRAKVKPCPASLSWGSKSPAPGERWREENHLVQQPHLHTKNGVWKLFSYIGHGWPRENSCHPILEQWGHCCPQLSKALTPRGRGELCWRALLAPHFSPLLMTKKTT